MALTRQNIMDELGAMRAELSRLYSVERIGVFGSFARGEETPESDVDILVELSEPTFDHYMDLKFALEDRFGRSVDLVMPDALKPRMKPSVEREIVYA